MSNALSPSGLGHWMHQNSVNVHWICLISLKKVNAHLLTSKLLIWHHWMVINSPMYIFDELPSFIFIFQYQAYSTAVRFLFPNNDTVTLPARSGCSVRDAILPLCEARGLPVQALEIFQSESKEVSLVYRSW